MMLKQWPARAGAFRCCVCGDATQRVGPEGWFYNVAFRGTRATRAYCPFCAQTLRAAGMATLVNITGEQP